MSANFEGNGDLPRLEEEWAHTSPLPQYRCRRRGKDGRASEDECRQMSSVFDETYATTCAGCESPRKTCVACALSKDADKKNTPVNVNGVIKILLRMVPSQKLSLCSCHGGPKENDVLLAHRPDCVSNMVKERARRRRQFDSLLLQIRNRGPAELYAVVHDPETQDVILKIAAGTTDKLSVMQEARAIFLLKQEPIGLSTTDAAFCLGKSPSCGSARLRLLELDQQVIAMIASGQLLPTIAACIARKVRKGTKQFACAMHIVNRGLAYDAAHRYIKERSKATKSVSSK